MQKVVVDAAVLEEKEEEQGAVEDVADTLIPPKEIAHLQVRLHQSKTSSSYSTSSQSQSMV